MELTRRQIMLLAIAVACLSLCILFIAIELVKPQEVTVSMAKEMDSGSYIKLYGKLESVNAKPDFSSMRLCDDIDCMTVTKDGPPIYSKGDYVFVIGTIEEYFSGKMVRAREVNIIG